MEDALKNDFKEFRRQIFALYDRQAYAEALALIDQRAETFQEFEAMLFFWRACFAGCMGDREQAIGWLRQAADRGHWYSEQSLRDPDLMVIHGSEELAQLQVVFNERQRQAQASSRPEREVWEPAGAPKGLVVALHGAGGSILTEGDYWRLAVELGWRVAMLQSSQVHAPGRYHWADRDKAAEELGHHLAELSPDIPTVLSGYSMGGGLAIRSVLSGPARALGFFVVAPSFRLEEVEPLLTTADKGLRGYIVVGTEDPWSYGRARELADAMRKAGLQCVVEEIAGLDHDYPPDFSSCLRRGLEFLCGGERVGVEPTGESA